MTEYYSIKLTVCKKKDQLTSFFGELIAGIRKWLDYKYGVLKVTNNIPNWSSFKDGGKFGHDITFGNFYSKTQWFITDDDYSKASWLCEIYEYPHCDPKYVPRRWITEISYFPINDLSAEIVYSVKFENLNGYDGLQLPIPQSTPRDMPKALNNLINSHKWICNISCQPNNLLSDSDSHYKTTINNGGRDSQVLTNSNNTNAKSVEKRSHNGESQMDDKWISLCKVNQPDINNQIWMLRIADVIDDTLVRPNFDEDENAQKIFDNRPLIFHENGPDIPDSIGYWEWTERQSNSGKWLSQSTYIDRVIPLEILLFEDVSSVEALVERLKSGVTIPDYICNTFLLARKNKSIIECVLCDISDFETKQGNGGVKRIKKQIRSLPYYELNVDETITFKRRIIYKHTKLGEPKSTLPVQPYYEAIREMFLREMTWPVFKAQGISKADWSKFTQFVKDIPQDTILDSLKKTYGISHQEAQESVDSFIKSVEKHINAEDVDAALIAKMVEVHSGLRQISEKAAEENWKKEHQAEIEAAQKDADKIRKEAEKEADAVNQKIAETKRAISSAEAKRDGILSEVANAEHKLAALQSDIKRYEEIGNKTVAGVQQKIAEAQKDVADFMADISVFLPMANAGHSISRNADTNRYLCGQDVEEADEGFEITESWQDEFDLLNQNLYCMFGASAEFCPMLAAYLYSAHINNVPMLITGPCGIEIADVISTSLFGKTAGKLTLGNNIDEYVVETIMNNEDQIVTIQDMFRKGWSDTLPQMFGRLNKQVIWTHPYSEDILIEPHGLFNYMLPILSESVIWNYTSSEVAAGKRSDNFEKYVSKAGQPLCLSTFKRLGLSRFLMNKLERVLTDAKAVLDNPSKAKDLEMLFGLLPLSVLTGKTDILKDVIEGENGISNSVKDEARRYVGEE